MIITIPSHFIIYIYIILWVYSLVFDVVGFYLHNILSPFLPVMEVVYVRFTGQVGLGVGSWPSNRATEGSNPK